MSTSDSPTLLEDRFRAVLRVLPAYYRREREEEMVDTFLSDYEPLDEEAELGRPRLREVAGVLHLAVRTRLAGHGAPARYVAYGRAARLVGLLGVALLAASTAVNLLGQAAVLLTGSGEDKRVVLDVLLGRSSGASPDALSAALALLVEVLPLGWIGAAVALGSGRRRRAAVFCAVASLPTFMYLGQSVVLGFPPSVTELATVALVVLVTGSVAMAFHPGAPRAEISRLAGEWITAACVLVLLAAAVAARKFLGFGDEGHGWVFLAGGAACLVLRARAHRGRPRAPEPSAAAAVPARRTRVSATDPALPTALAVLGLPVVTTCLDLLTYSMSVPGLPVTAFVTGVTEAAAVTVLEAALLVVAIRALRREPRVRSTSTAPVSAPPGL
ncbi:hypothetical protein [Streptomyces coffeae]|uniref:Uncharacterized protein n=1 Tax=Streptomyces coffeae TaxID=621382 RepID=A0ABS1NCY7_9ACTN|nr:hypothetical protein [Streptomyces coffeae]MBL1097691.1 hypothetical protein [Streptomyces coffeae]